jgi:hypothetical protein
MDKCIRLAVWHMPCSMMGWIRSYLSVRFANHGGRTGLIGVLDNFLAQPRGDIMAIFPVLGFSVSSLLLGECTHGDFFGMRMNLSTNSRAVAYSQCTMQGHVLITDNIHLMSEKTSTLENGRDDASQRTTHLRNSSFGYKALRKVRLLASEAGSEWSCQ